MFSTSKKKKQVMKKRMKMKMERNRKRKRRKYKCSLKNGRDSGELGRGRTRLLFDFSFWAETPLLCLSTELFVRAIIIFVIENPSRANLTT